MKKIFYIIPMLLLAASCSKEPVEQKAETSRVPLNITITTKAGGSGSGEEASFDVNSIRVAVFKDLKDASDLTKDILVLNDYYPFGFGVEGSEEKGTDSTYTVTVKPTLELDLDCDDYYVYVILNEDGYKLKDGKNLASELSARIANRSLMETLFHTPAVYDDNGVKDAPFCLMAASKQISFGADKDRPMDVKFTVSSNDALKRNMAQITVGSIRSVIPTGTLTAADSLILQELPKIFVRKVELVNVPKDMTWSTDQGSTSTNTANVTLPIGNAKYNATAGYYNRRWDGYAYRYYDVTMNEVDVPSAKLYRTNRSGVDGWGFSNPYLYQVSTVPPTEPATKPYGWPWKGGDNKYHYYYYKDAGHPAAEEKKPNLDEAKSAYLNALPYDSSLGRRLELADIQYYLDYLDALDEYNEGPAASYKAANAAIKKVDNASVPVKNALDALFAAGDEEFWENTKTTAEVSGVATSQSDTRTYCTLHTWSIDLDESYYVPENISASFDADSTTCIKVTLALAAPSVTLKDGYDIGTIPAPKLDEATGGTCTYWMSNDFFAKPKGGKSYNVPTTEEFNIGTATSGKLHINHKNDKDQIDGYKKNDGGKIDTDKLNDGGIMDYSLAELFKLYGHIVDTTGVEYALDLKNDDIPTVNNFNVYIDGIYRKVNGLTGRSAVLQSSACAEFAWNLGATDKVFYIPVNQNIDGTGCSIVRNTKYTVDLTVTADTYDAVTKASASADNFGFSITAEVTTEKINEYED